MTGLDLVDAKRIYVAATEGMTLDEYQARIWEQLLLLEQMDDTSFEDNVTTL